MVAVLLPMLRAFTCKSSDQLHHPQCSRHWAERNAHPVYTCFQIELTEGIPTPYVYQRTLELQILPKTVPLMNHEPWFEEETWAFPLCLDFLWGLHPGLQPSNRKTPCLRWLSVLGNHDWGGAAGMDFWIYKWAIKKSWLLIVLGIAAAEILPNYISDYNKPFKEIPKNPTMGPWKCHVGGFWSMSGWHYLAAWDQTIAYTWGAPGPPEGRVIQIPCKVGSWWCFGTSPAMSGKFRLVKCYEKFGQMLSNQYKFTRNDPLTLTLQRNCALLW